MPTLVATSGTNLCAGTIPFINRDTATITSLLQSIEHDPVLFLGRDHFGWTDIRYRQNAVRISGHGFTKHWRQTVGTAEDSIYLGVPQHDLATAAIAHAVISMCCALRAGRTVHTWHSKTGQESIITWIDQHRYQPAIIVAQRRIHTERHIPWPPHANGPEAAFRTVETDIPPATGQTPITESLRNAQQLHQEAMSLATRGFITQMENTPAQAIPLFEQALEQDLAAIGLLEQPVEPAWSILHRSAGWIAVHCRRYETAVRLAETGLAASPRANADADLCALLTAARTGISNRRFGLQ